MFFLPLIHTLPQTQNQKSTTNIKNQPQNQPLEQNRLIGDRWLWIVDWKGDLDRCWWRSVMGWRRSVLMEIGFNGDRCWWSAWDGLTEISVDGVLVMVLLGWRRLVDWRGIVVLMECLFWCFWVLTVRERRRKNKKKRKRNRQRYKEKERRRKKRENKKEKMGDKIILKKEYKNIIYIKYNV